MKKLRISILSFVLFLVVGISSISNVDALTTKCKTAYAPSKKIVAKTSTSTWTYQGFYRPGGGNGKPSMARVTNTYKNTTSRQYRSVTSYYKPAFLWMKAKTYYSYGPWVNKNKESYSVQINGLDTHIFNVCYQIK